MYVLLTFLSSCFDGLIKMYDSRFPRDSLFRSDSQYTPEGGGSSSTHPTILKTQLVDAQGYTQTQTFNRLNYPPEYMLLAPGGGPGTNYPTLEGSQHLTHLVGCGSLHSHHHR